MAMITKSTGADELADRDRVLDALPAASVVVLRTILSRQVHGIARCGMMMSATSGSRPCPRRR
jgi:hypothetical protein